MLALTSKMYLKTCFLDSSPGATNGTLPLLKRNTNRYTSDIKSSLLLVFLNWNWLTVAKIMLDLNTSILSWGKWLLFLSTYLAANPKSTNLISYEKSSLLEWSPTNMLSNLRSLYVKPASCTLSNMSNNLIPI